MMRRRRFHGMSWVMLVGCLVLFSLTASLRAEPQQEASSGSGSEQAAAEPNKSPADVQAIIQQFAAKEAEFRRARENYTYRQIVKVQELDSEGEVGGIYQVDTDVIFTPQGARVEKVVYAPLSTLRKISISPEDERDLRSIQPFILTTEELPKYTVIYQGRQKVDELSTYVFRVSPKELKPGERYFDGMVWVDDRDHQIVKSYGKAVPDIRKNGQENLFPRFETYREQIDGKYWFPTWTGADDTLYFSNGPQRIRMLVRYEDYKQFKTETTITYGDEAEQAPQLR